MVPKCHHIATIRASDPLLLQPELNQPLHLHELYTVTCPDTGNQLEYRELIRHNNPTVRHAWQRSSANEFGRLAQGVGGRIQGTNTIFFIPKHKIPKNKMPTYARFVCTYRPQKSEPNRTRLTVGGNLIRYPGDVSTRIADLTTAIIHLNSTISDTTAKYMCMDIRNFYLGTPLPNYEYIRFHIDDIPLEIQLEYNLQDICSNGWIYAEIRKGMYGLPQAGILANNLLRKRLANHGYYECTHTPGLWRHNTRNISFVLVVDDFGIKYSNKEDALHLAAALKQHYDVTVDWDASLFVGISLDWNYSPTNRSVTLSMPDYVKKALRRFTHPPPTKPEHSPHRAIEKQYGVKIQLTEPPDNTAALSSKAKTRIQQIVGTFLYYARAVDPTMAVTLSTLAAAQSKGTEATAKAVTQFLNYAATNPDAAIRYTPSDMILRVHSDTSYLSEPQARSRAGGHFYLGNAHNDSRNGSILNPTGVIKVVVSSAAEAETAGLFTNMKEAVILRTILHEMGHPQPATPIQVDNSTAAGIANDNIKLQRSKAIDMRFYWVRDRVDQKQFHVYWKPGRENDADYFTKHHTAAHHQRMRPRYLHTTPFSKPARAHCEGVLIPMANTLGLLDPVPTERTSHAKTVTLSDTRVTPHTRAYSIHNTSQAKHTSKLIF